MGDSGLHRLQDLRPFLALGFENWCLDGTVARDRSALMMGQPLARGPAPGLSGWGLLRRERHRLLDTAVEMKSQKPESQETYTVQDAWGRKKSFCGLLIASMASLP